MQINHYPERYKKTIEWVLKIGATAACLYFISTKAGFESLDFSMALSQPGVVVAFGAAMVLMPLNWALEAEKWRIAVPEEHLSFSAALQSVLVGLSLNWVVPFTLGDAGGRLAGLHDYKRASVSLLICRAILLAITVYFGAMAVLFYFGWLDTPVFILLLVLAVGTCAVAMRRYSPGRGSVWGQVLALSLLRYAVFTLQFFLLLRAFLPEVSVPIIVLGVGWVFLFRTFIPSLLGNFGVREASAMVFFSPFVGDMNMVLLPCLLIWLINTVVPSLFGAACVFKLKLNIAQ